MPALRELLSKAGFENVRTYVASGNAVLDAELEPERVAEDSERLISDAFGFEIDVLVRTRDELAAIVDRNPFRNVVTEPRYYHVNFLSREPDRDFTEHLMKLATGGEQIVGIGREQYVWLPSGAGRSKLWATIARVRPGLIGTARNWRTVTGLLAMAEE
jgi:uncharacterized protein (DUF1697 family)